jgi:HAD superfamily hydrolase (TIGR01509 family)
MIIIIPLCGKGQRFHPDNKPFVKVFDKCILKYIIDSIVVKPYIIVNDRTYCPELEEYGQLINIHKETVGAAETIFEGIIKIDIKESTGVLLIDGDNFYTYNIVEKIRESPHINQIFSFEDDSRKPIFSYSLLDNKNKVIDIREKERISCYANTGAYYFSSCSLLQKYCKKILDKKLYFKGEAYTSSVIHNMIQDNIDWYCNIIPKNTYFSLGTPEQVTDYIKNTYAFLFDLDGTLVNTDHIYYEVWREILLSYNIVLTKEIFNTYIFSNSDIYVKNTLLSKFNITVNELSIIKDKLFMKHIDKITIIPGSKEFIENIKKDGHKIAIVTNANRITATSILNYIGLNKYNDILIIGSECTHPKPSPDPYLAAAKYFNISTDKCIVFEDSHNGILSAKGISPKCIVGIGSDKDYFTTVGVTINMPNFNDIDIKILLNFEQKVYNYNKYIYNSLNNRFKNIKDLVIHPITLKGGFIADVYSISFFDGDVKHDAIFKVENINDSDLNKTAHTLELYNRENYFYESISPYVNVNIPYFYGLVRDDQYKIIGIILENLNKENFYLNMDLNKENINTALSVIDNMAKLHASFWNKDLPSKFFQLKKNNDPSFNPKWYNFVNERIDKFICKWDKILSESDKKLFKELAINYINIQNNVSEEPLTLVHGDIKSPNIFYNKIDNIITPYFIDWQYITYGKGVQDLVFFMIESFTKENLAQYYTLFKEFYYIKLKEYGISTYSKEQYNIDFKNAAYYFPYFVAIWFGTTSTDDLIDVNFPYFYIDRLLNFYKLI